MLALDIGNGFGWAWVVLGDSRGAQRVLTALDASAVGLPTSLAELDVAEGELPGLARQALGVGRLIVNNPRELGEEELLEILRAAWRGELARPAPVSVS